MTMDSSWPIVVLAPAIAASVGAYFSARLGVAHAERAENSRLRRDSAEEIIAALTPLRDLLRDVQENRDVKQWMIAVNTAYDAIEDAQYRAPSTFRHLKQSIRVSLGEAVGAVCWADSQPFREQVKIAEYNYRWNQYAIEYVELVMGSLREWRDASVKTAPRVRLLSFDRWLAATDRYHSGQDGLQVK